VGGTWRAALGGTRLHETVSNHQHSYNNSLREKVEVPKYITQLEIKWVFAIELDCTILHHWDLSSLANNTNNLVCYQDGHRDSGIARR